MIPEPLSIIGLLVLAFIAGMMTLIRRDIAAGLVAVALLAAVIG
jgi:F0F1-type ATP synthase assembly protein I